MPSSYLSFDLSEHKQLKDFVVQALKRQRNVQDVLIPQIIERTGWDWPMSEDFVKQVQLENGIEIAVFTEQLYLYLGWGIAIAGAALIMVMYETSFGVTTLVYCLNQDIHGYLNSNNSFANCSGWQNPGLIQDFLNAAYIGFMMIVGGIIGIVKSLGRLHSNGLTGPMENIHE